MTHKPAQGDLKAGVHTLTVRLGTAVPFWSCIWILTAAYVGACGYSVVMASMAQPAGTSLALSAAPASLSLVPALPVKTLVSVASVESVAAAAEQEWPA